MSSSKNSSRLARLILLFALITSLAGLCQDSSQNQELGQKQTKEKAIVFRSATELIPPGRIRLANGFEVDRRDWTTLIMAAIPLQGSDKQQYCSGTLVGPNTILLAAHCVDTWSGRPRPAQLWIDSRRISMNCEMHPNYVKHEYQFGTTRSSEDFALCLLNDGGRHPASFADMSFEVIDATTHLNSGEPVLMTGYGCSQLQLAANGVADWVSESGVLRIGDESIASVVGQWSDNPAYVTTISKQGRDPVLCPGDSGGPLFSGVTVALPGNIRRVRGINSKFCTLRRGDTNMCTTAFGPGIWDIVSGFAATEFTSFRPWVIDWLERNASKEPIVCGINRLAGETPCRP